MELKSNDMREEDCDMKSFGAMEFGIEMDPEKSQCYYSAIYKIVTRDHRCSYLFFLPNYFETKFFMVTIDN